MFYKTNNPHGGDIYGGEITYDFSSNANPFGPPESVVAAVVRSMADIHRYPDPYCRELVHAIAEYENVPEKYILCGNGSAELIYSFCRATTPEKAVETAPTFAEYGEAARAASDCCFKRYLLRRENDFEFKEDFIDFLRANNARTNDASTKDPETDQPDNGEVVFLCNPNNPTGQTIPENMLVSVLEYCRERKSRLFLDECFLGLTTGGKSMKGYLEKYPQLFILKAFTKSYALPGIRLGYCLCSDPELLERMSRNVQPWNVSVPAQAAGVAALREPDYPAQSAAAIAGEREWLKAQLGSLGLWVCPSEANYLLFKGPRGLDKELLKKGIAIRNCDNYHGLGAGWYRVAVRIREENMALAEALKKACYQ